MPYSETIRQTTSSAQKTLGNQLGRWAIKLDFPVIKIAEYTGATRQSIYNWFGGSEVSPAYREHVRNLLTILQSSATSEEAMRKCNKK
jgi:hypothetical protein